MARYYSASFNEASFLNPYKFVALVADIGIENSEIVYNNSRCLSGGCLLQGFFVLLKEKPS